MEINRLEKPQHKVLRVYADVQGGEDGTTFKIKILKEIYSLTPTRREHRCFGFTQVFFECVAVDMHAFIDCPVYVRVQ